MKTESSRELCERGTRKLIDELSRESELKSMLACASI
jgi:hypothetical protein